MARSSFISLCLVVMFSASVSASGQAHQAKCERFSSRMCADIGYNMTRFPNSLGHTSAQNAELELNQFYPLVQIKCSPQLKPFLCSLHFPQCHASEVVLPCRALCAQARSGCEPIMRQYGFAWPEALRCEKFPETGNCFSPAVKGPVLIVQSTLEPEITTLKKSISPALKTQEAEKTEVEKSKPETDTLKKHEYTAKCERFSSRMCDDIGYNMTRFPNSLGHTSAQNAELELNQFYPLVQIKCSPHLKPFLCSLHFPQCHASEVVLPCRALCAQARSGCEPIMRRFGFPWPEAMSCERYPETGNCFSPDEDLPRSDVKTQESEKKEAEKAKPGKVPVVRMHAEKPVSKEELSKEIGFEKIEPEIITFENRINPARCEKFSSKLCADIGYNMARVPNSLGHTSAYTAAEEVSKYFPLINIECSPQLQPFLCSLHFPQCQSSEVVLPCRALCAQARSGCEPIMRKYSFGWPKELTCERFPESGNCFAPGNVLSKLNSTKSTSEKSKWQRKIKKSKKTLSKKSRAYQLRRKWRKEIMQADEPRTAPRPSTRGRGGLVKSCLSFDSDFCPNIPYHLGGFPNLLSHRNPEQANKQLRELLPLMRTGCSARLHDFLCGVHFPQCIERHVTAPCRSLCEKVQADCSPDLARLGFAWPRRLRCYRFPDTDCFGSGSEPIITAPAGLVNKRPSEDGAEKPSSSSRESDKSPSELRDQPSQGSAVDIPPEVMEAMSGRIMHPFMEWIVSSTKLNKDQATLAQEEALVAKLTEQKLGLEISEIQDGQVQKGDP